MKRYKYDEWSFRWEEGLEYGGFDDRVYVDAEGQPITGLLEGFYGYTADTSDEQNCQIVKDGKREMTMT